MATVLDVKLVLKTLALVEKYGTLAAFSVLTPGTYNPATRETTATAIQPYSRNVTPPTSFKTEFIDGTTVKAGDLWSLVAASGLAATPTIGSLVTINSVQYVIQGIETFMSGDQIAAYQLHLRK